MMELYPRIYKALKLVGHSPTKALEILLDAMRGDSHALGWIRIVHNQVRNLKEDA